MNSLTASLGIPVLVAAIVVGCVGLQDTNVVAARPAIELAPIQVDPAWCQEQSDAW
jgi:hypothetical protein